jgi:hypothetical protein
MKLIRFGPPGKENPGILLEDGTRLEIYGFVSEDERTFFGKDGILKTSEEKNVGEQEPTLHGCR